MYYVSKSFIYIENYFYISDYVGFIKKIIKLMQQKYNQLKILEIELRQEGHGPPPPGNN